MNKAGDNTAMLAPAVDELPSLRPFLSARGPFTAGTDTPRDFPPWSRRHSAISPRKSSWLGLAPSSQPCAASGS